MTKKLKSFPLIRQTGMMECGTTCLAMVFKHYGYYDIRRFLSEQAEVNLEGTDLYTLSQLAQQFGFDADGYQMGYEDMLTITLPMIAHFENNHFVVVYRATKDKVWVADPARGKHTFTRKEFEEKWNGIALILEPTPEIFKHSELTELVEASRKRDKSLIKKFYLSSIVASKKAIITILIGTAVAHLLGLSIPVFTQALIDSVLVNKNLKLLYAILASMLIFFVTLLLVRHAKNLILSQFRTNFERSFFSKFFQHFVKLDQDFFDRYKKEDFINRFYENVRFRQTLSPAAIESVLNFLFSFIYLSVLISYNTTLGLIAISVLVLSMTLTIYMAPRLREIEEQSFHESMGSMGMFIDTLLGIQTVRLLGIENLRYHKWRNQYTRALNKGTGAMMNYTYYATFISAVWLLGQVFIYWYGAYLTFENQMTIGAYVAFTSIFMMVYKFLADFANMTTTYISISVSFKKLNDILCQPARQASSAARPLPKEPINIRIKHLRFKYLKNAPDQILNEISMDIQPGQFVGIVGRNGSGKSTLIKLLSHLYDHYEGDILLNNINLREIREDSLRKRMAVIPQDVYVFDGTLKENILFGNIHATDEEVLAAVEQANLLDFIKSQYLGLNTRIGENGVKLSGGQQLKMAFARLFVADPEIIILDEASSALDMQTEQRIMQNLRTRFKDKTIISVAHRLHTLKSADNIFVIEQGRIEEQGTHEELMTHQGIYRQFIDTYISY